jgi:hypothetical protein
VYESVEDDSAGPRGGPAKSVEGYIIIATGVHEEAQVGRYGGRLRPIEKKTPPPSLGGEACEAG